MTYTTPSALRIAEWIEAGELEKWKRLEGIIIETFFSKFLKKNPKIRELSEGWIYQKDPNATTRTWYKIETTGHQLNTTDIRIVKALEQLGHSFYSVEWSLKENKKQPIIEIKTNKITTNRNTSEIESTPCENTSKSIQQLINKHITQARLTSNFATASRQGKEFTNLLLNTPPSELACIFIRRCLMNALEAPIDLDAAAILIETDSLVFMELKRKYPAKNKYSSSSDASQTFATAKKLANETFLTNKNDPYKEFGKILYKHGIKKNPCSCFGLDDGHFETLKLCSDCGFQYAYIIWVSKDLPEHRKSDRASRISVLNNLLNKDLTYKSRPEWWLKYLKPTDSNGISFTAQGDSGSYSKKIRIQRVFDE